MSDNLNIFGTTYSNVTGIKATDTNNVVQTFIKPTGTKSITANGTGIDVTEYASVDVSVPSAGSANVQVAQSTTRVNTTSYAELVTLTCSVTGTYDVYWSTFRTSVSGTWGSQLYINDNAYGDVESTFTNHIQNVHLTNVSLTANDVIAVWAKSRGNAYYGYVGTLTIIQKS